MKTPLLLENDSVAAFSDINPQAPVHVLVVPKEHVETTNELSGKPELVQKLFLACLQVAEQTGLAEDGYRIVANCGAKAGQSVYHVHFHLLGGRPMSWPPG